MFGKICLLYEFVQLTIVYKFYLIWVSKVEFFKFKEFSGVLKNSITSLLWEWIQLEYWLFRESEQSSQIIIIIVCFIYLCIWRDDDLKFEEMYERIANK